ncbi:MAG: lipid-A-disaccharide synthase, partial [Calditrichia bacterium]|nr:lipid-A-disaccharide synthase [Calditrichia bacterium]
NKNIMFVGIGGDLMADEGVELLEHNKNMAFLGLWEVIKHIGFIKKKITQIKNYIVNEKLDIVLLIDYPGFNMKIAAFAKKNGIPVVYYILPKVWAWGQNRVKKIKKNIDLPLIILPFEKEFYAKHGVDVKYVGHPSLETIKNNFSKKEFLKKYNLDENKKIIGLLPGSRKMEIEALLPDMLKTVKELSKKYDNLQFIMSKSDNLPDELYDVILKEYNLPVIKINKYPYDVMKHSDIAIVASGTASLETAILGTPSIVLYKVNPLTYWVAKKVVNVPYISLTNLILKKEVFPELIQGNCTPEKIIDKIDCWFSSEIEFNIQTKEVESILQEIGLSPASENAAMYINDLLNSV